MDDRFSPAPPHQAEPPQLPAPPHLAEPPYLAGRPAVERLAQYTRAEQEEVLGPGDDPYGVAYTGLTFLPKEIHFGIRAAGGRLVAHTGLLPLPLTAGGTDLTVMGVGGVCVAPDRRGGGLAQAVVGAALDHARALGHRHALLFCRPPLAAFYRGLGFREVAEEVTVEQPQGRLAVMPLRTMWTALAAGAGWPEGPVRLRSLPM
ncbi:GNAT family N-acetyltransferase [Streptomyces sp. 1331.2]|uniref:GNAT family N-acetyltransferase n=1 Tax=Streptomyces sp. 1331.2 TaxID=1938835 RepID=UPI000BD84624|nr:GNAT family N-acetyltransferase [Streptomyces sp. 1331.2]SOB84717.1 Acetyltransferase (GNAT) domain-containing protein [Streptomyces sp. 1331.2]